MTDYDFSGEFQSIGIFQSLSIAYNIGNITRAIVRLPSAAMSNPSAFNFYLSNDGGTTWDIVSLNRYHTFNATGNDLRLRIIAPSGESINLLPGDGFRYQIKVLYDIA